MVPSQKAEVSVVPALEEEGAAQTGLGRKQELRPPAHSASGPFRDHQSCFRFPGHFLVCLGLRFSAYFQA